jgi:aminocarboxymuconate-semialdehyde decarboxylase
MPNRRDVLKVLGGAAGLSLAGKSAPILGQVPRKEVRIDGEQVRVVDIHAHCVFPEVEDVIRGTNLEGVRTFPDWYLLGPERLEAMDGRGIDVQALSINLYWWYAADRDLAARIVQLHDEKLADWCATNPERFVALTSVALQYPDLAAEQLEYAVTELGHRGAAIGRTVLGEMVSLPKYDPFWTKAEELGVPVFMHPADSVHLLREGGLTGPGNQGNILGNPFETTVFLTNLILDGTLDRFPELRVCGAHGGGYLPSYIGRTDVACQTASEPQPGYFPDAVCSCVAMCSNQKLASEYLRDQIIVDSMVFTAEGLRHLVEVMGPSQIVYGSDQPFAWPDTLDLIVDSPDLSASEKAAILGGSLASLLKLDAEKHTIPSKATRGSPDLVVDRRAWTESR